MYTTSATMRLLYQRYCYLNASKTVREATNKEEYETNKADFTEKDAIVAFCKEELE